MWPVEEAWEQHGRMGEHHVPTHAHIHTTTRGCQFLNIKGKSIYFNSLFEKVETILVHPTQSEIIQGFHYSFQLLGLWQKDKKKKASI